MMLVVPTNGGTTGEAATCLARGWRNDPLRAVRLVGRVPVSKTGLGAFDSLTARSSSSSSIIIPS
jgi:hypothetical protein